MQLWQATHPHKLKWKASQEKRMKRKVLTMSPMWGFKSGVTRKNILQGENPFKSYYGVTNKTTSIN